MASIKIIRLVELYREGESAHSLYIDVEILGILLHDEDSRKLLKKVENFSKYAKQMRTFYTHFVSELGYMKVYNRQLPYTLL